MNFKEKLTQQQIRELEAYIKRGTNKSQESKRAQAILLVEQEVSNQLLGILTALKHVTAVKLRKRFIKDGLDAIKNKREDKKPRSLLTRNQRKQLATVLVRDTPIKYGYDCSYWTTWILSHLIFEQYGVKYKSRTSIYVIFKESKFTYHKPERVSCRHNQKLIDEWKKTKRTIMKKAFKNNNTVILTGDEMVLSTQTTVQKVWLPQGEQAFVDVTINRKSCSIYGFLNVKTGQEHAFKTKKQTMQITCKILDKIGKLYPNKKIVIFWDNAPWHRGSKVREFLSETQHDFYLVNFPPYAPEENPQEHVWKNAREHVTHNKFLKNIEWVSNDFVNYLNNSIFKYSLLGFKA